MVFKYNFLIYCAFDSHNEVLMQNSGERNLI